MKKLGIIGCGGFGREVLDLAIKLEFNLSKIIFFESDNFFKDRKVNQVEVKPLSKFCEIEYDAIVAVGDPKIRMSIINQLPKNTNYINLISKQANLSKNAKIGRGIVIMDFCYVTDNAELGNHVHLNNNSSVGHDSKVGDYFTTAAGVRISGSCNIGNNVYFGHNSSTIQGIDICDNVKVGINSTILKSINISGTYFGLPAKKIF